MREAGLDVSAPDLTVGAAYGRDWVSGDLLVGGIYSGMMLEVHGGDAVAASAWQDALGEPGAPALPLTPGLCILTLSGKTHDEAFERLRTFLMEERGAAEYDESDGFTGA